MSLPATISLRCALTPVSVGPYNEVNIFQVNGALPAPSQPADLTANVDYNLATLFWSPVTDTGTAGYDIYRDYQWLDTVHNTNLTSYQIVFTDTSPHVYSVRAFNTNKPPA